MANEGSGGQFGRFFMGESTSEVDVRWGLGRDVWSAVEPDISRLARPIMVANRKFGRSPSDVQAVVVAALVASYRNNPPPAQFRMVVSPMIAWIWIGGAIVLIGSLTALWPTAEARRRRAASLAAARLGRELSRA